MIDGYQKAKKMFEKSNVGKIILFVTGAAPNAAADVIEKLWNQNLTKDEMAKIPHFYMQSAYEIDHGAQMMKRICKKIITILFLLYLAIVLRITVFRSTFTLHHLCQNGKVILTLFEGYIDLVRRGDWFAFTYLFVGNIVWFVPFGMYLQYMGRQKTLLHTAIYGFLFSLLIETLQYVFGTGFSELDDLILNTLGAWIGGMIFQTRTRVKGF